MVRKVLSATITLVLANIAVFLLQGLFGNSFTNYFLLNSAEVLARPYIILTSMFLHADFTHILFNMYALFMFGPLVEQKIGTKRFYGLYFISGIVAALASIPLYDRALGASGAVMGIIGAIIMLFPHLKVLLFFIIPVSMRTAGILFALIDLTLIFFPTGIASAAHLGGLAVGLLYGWYLLRKRNQFREKFTVKVERKGRPQVKKTSTLMTDDDIEEYLKHGRI